MNLARLAERVMSMDDETWARHANPWSFWTRFATGSTSITLAAWSRVWIDGWAWPLVVLALIWIRYNPRAFSLPETPTGWASRAVFGERIWIDQRADIPRHHRIAGRTLTLLAALASGIWIWGLVMLDVSATLFGLVVSMLAKMWFVDRMAWLFENLQDTDPRYHAWLRGDFTSTPTVT